MHLIETRLSKISTLSTPQRKFLVTLLTTIHVLRGKMTFRNLSRYRDVHEKTYARHFQRAFDFAICNHLAMTAILPVQTTKIAAMDCTVVSKSGKQTYGLDYFYPASHNRPEKGLEFSELAVVDVD
jgi:hypothetical protein